MPGSALLAECRRNPQLSAVSLLLLATPAVFFGTTATMVKVWWSNETFTHGFLILPISLWLIWGRREALAGAPMQRDLRATILALPLLGGWLLATLADVAVVEQLSMLALVSCLVWLLLGASVTLTVLFPLAYLFFAVPLGQGLIPPMMEFTADFTVRMVQLSGVPIFRDGLSFELPSGSWSVVEECSGVRYLIASAALGALYAYLTYRSATKRLIFFAVALVVPIVANGLRAYGIVMIGHLSGMKYAVGADHLLYGWVFFGLVVFVLFWIGSFWADPPDAKPPGNGSAPTTEHGSSTGTQQPYAGIGMVLAVLACINTGVYALTSADVILPEGAQITLPEQAGLWEMRAAQADDQRWTPLPHNPDLKAHGDYALGGETVRLDIAYFHQQRDGSETVSSLNRLTNPYEGSWRLIAQREVDAAGHRFIESEVTRGNRKTLVWSTHRVGSDFVANPYLAKLRDVLALVQGQRSGAWITLSVSADSGNTAALRPVLSDAWAALEPAVVRVVDTLGDTH